MKYTTVLFDWDGCLFNNLTTWLEIYTSVLHTYHIETTNKLIAEKMFGNWNGPLSVGIKQNELEQFNIDLLSLADKMLPESKLHVHTRALLSTLIKFGTKIGLVSTSKLVTIEPILHKHKMFDLFGVIVTGDMVKNHKPDPESMHLAMAKLNSKDTDTLMIGDSEKDVFSANNAGIDSVLFLPDLHKEIYNFEYLKSTNPTYIVKDLNEVVPIVSAIK